MGCAASSCTISNKALYNITVEVFGATDFEGAIPKQQITMLPGQTTAIAIRKAAFLRVSGRQP